MRPTIFYHLGIGLWILALVTTAGTSGRGQRSPQLRSGDLFGCSVASGFDVNSDGKLDIAIGAPGFEAAEAPGCGAVFIVSGKDGTLIRLIRGGAHQRLGNSVTLLPDARHVGTINVVATTTVLSSPDTRVRVFSALDGNPVSQVRGDVASNAIFVQSMPDTDHDGAADLLLLDGAAIAVVSGATYTERFAFNGGADTPGSSASAVPDMNGDGIPEILLGNPGANSGRAYIISGSNGNKLRELNVAGETDNLDEFGFAVAGGGDFDKDGIADLVVGDPCTLDGCENGRVWILSGKNFSVLRTLQAPQDIGGYGSCVAVLKDIDGDAVSDIAIGASSKSSALCIVSGASFCSLFTLKGPEDEPHCFDSVAGCGDVDGDGVGDLVAGSQSDRHVGPQYPGRVRVISGKTGLVLYSITASDLTKR